MLSLSEKTQNFAPSSDGKWPLPRSCHKKSSASAVRWWNTSSSERRLHCGSLMQSARCAALYAGRGTVFVPYEFIRHPGGKRQASNTAAVAHAGPDSGPPVIPGDIDNCGFSRSYVVACARTWAAPRGTRQTIIKLQPAVPAHCASDTTHSTQQPTPTVTRQSHISGNILKAAERAAVHSQQELQNTPGAMQIFVRALNARR